MASHPEEEAGVQLAQTEVVEPDAVFDLRPPGVPPSAVPIFDDELSAVIGYRFQAVAGVFKLVDLEGKLVGMEEVPLETPLFDPIDLLFLFGGPSARSEKGSSTV